MFNDCAERFEDNVTLEKIVVTIKNGGARVKINKFETRNKEISRRKRTGSEWSSLDPRNRKDGASSNPNAASGQDSQVFAKTEAPAPAPAPAPAVEAPPAETPAPVVESQAEPEAPAEPQVESADEPATTD
jgi:type V secretory pathway adhesin AidA